MRRLHTAEEGAVAVITALVLTALLIVAAFIIDLGALRADKLAGKSAADMAASAAAIDYRPGTAGAPNAACHEVVAYAVENLRGVTGPAIADPGASCDDIYPMSYVCDPADSRRAVYTLGPYTIDIAIPVQDGPDDYGLLQGLAHDEDFDGAPCDRIGVRIERTRDFLLGGITGQADGRTSPGTVAKVAEGDDGEFASLVVLQRTGCETLYSTGGGQLRVNRLELGGSQTYQGIVSVDTQPAGCSSNDTPGAKKIIRAGGTGLIWADGEIRSYALASTDTANVYTFRPSGVGASVDATQGIWPAPLGGDLVTRALVDHRFNCQPTGYGSAVYEPSSAQPIDACETDPASPPYMQYLHQWLASGTGVPDADGTWHEADPAICDKNAGAQSISGHSRVFIDCSGSGNFEPDDVTITGASYVVVNGRLNMGNQESLTITGPSPQGTVLVLRNGDFNRTGGDLKLKDVFTYNVAGRLDLRGTDGAIWWKGPDKLTPEQLPACMPTPGRPTASCFGPLAYWGNSTADSDIRGEAKGGVIGTLFTPNAKTVLRGGQSVDQTPCSSIPTWSDLQASTGSLNLTGAQFFSNRFDLAGSSGLRLCPNPNLLTTSGWKSNLIR
jgi:hypothetical protein